MLSPGGNSGQATQAARTQSPTRQQLQSGVPTTQASGSISSGETPRHPSSSVTASQSQSQQQPHQQQRTGFVASGEAPRQPPSSFGQPPHQRVTSEATAYAEMQPQEEEEPEEELHRSERGGGGGTGSEHGELCRCRTLLTELSQMSYKSEICHKHVFYGHCSYGQHCQFAHGFHELRAKEVDRRFKTTLCANWHVQGFCNHGKRCKFLHDEFRIEASPGEFLLIYPRTGIARVELVPLTDTKRLALLRESIRERERLVFREGAPAGRSAAEGGTGLVEPEGARAMPGGSWMQTRLRHSISGRGSQMRGQGQPQPVMLVPTAEGLQQMPMSYPQQWMEQVPGGGGGGGDDGGGGDWLPIPESGAEAQNGHGLSPEQYEEAMQLQHRQHQQPEPPGHEQIPQEAGPGTAPPQPQRRPSLDHAQAQAQAQAQQQYAMPLIPAYVDPYTGQLWPITMTGQAMQYYQAGWNWHSGAPPAGAAGYASQELTAVAAAEVIETSAAQSRRPSATSAQNLQQQRQQQQLFMQQQQYAAYHQQMQSQHQQQQQQQQHQHPAAAAQFYAAQFQQQVQQGAYMQQQQQQPPYVQQQFQYVQHQRRRFSTQGQPPRSQRGRPRAQSVAGGIPMAGSSQPHSRRDSQQESIPEETEEELQQHQSPRQSAAAAAPVSPMEQPRAEAAEPTIQSPTQEAAGTQSLPEAAGSSEAAPSSLAETEDDVVQASRVEPKPRSPAAQQRIDSIFREKQQQQQQQKGSKRR